MSRPPLDLSLYLVTDTRLCGRDRVAWTVEQALAGGVTLVQVRDPDLDDEAFAALAREVVEIVAGRVPVLLNDRVHLVAESGADGAHVGQSDIAIATARRLLGPHRYLGLSVGTMHELQAARASGVDLDYLGVGPVWFQTTKADAAHPGGLAVLTEICAASPWPCVGIGGIDAARASQVVAAGADGVAVVSAICGQDDPTAAAGAFAAQSAPRTARRVPAKLLSIEGSDPSGGAGIQADLKTFSALGGYGMAVITALTAQSTQGVTGVHVVPAPFVRAQLETLTDDITPDAVKIGMLATAEIAEEVGRFLTERPQRHVVLDPVMVATSGDRLLDEAAVTAVTQLCAQADLITPNLGEAAVLLGGDPAASVAGMRGQAAELLRLGARRVLLKGGHLDHAATDVYADEQGLFELTAERIDTANTHGTGCTLSSAIAALRPLRPDWLTAVRDAKRWLTGALAAADDLQVGHGHGPVQHFHALWQ